MMGDDLEAEAMNADRPPLGPFVRRWAAAVAVGLLLVSLTLLVWRSTHVLLIVFAGVLFATFLSALADFAHRWARLPRGWALAAVVVLLLGLCAGVGFLVGPRVADQFSELADRLPRAWDDARQALEQYAWFQWLVGHASLLRSAVPAGTVGGYASGVAEFFIEFVIVMFFGLFFAAQPGVYRRGLLLLVPPRKRDRCGHVLDEVGSTLRWWLLGRIVSMAVIGVLDGVGLWLLGVPLPLTLGIIAGLFTFVPNFGPIASAVPAVLMALTRRTTRGCRCGSCC